MLRHEISGSYGISIFICQETVIKLSTVTVPIFIPTNSVGMFSSVAQLCPTVCDPMDCRTREGSGTPLQYTRLENPMDGVAGCAAICGVTQSRTRLKQLSSSSSRTPECQASLSNSNSWGLLKLTSIKLVMPSNHLILCHPLLLLPSIFPRIRVFSSESALCIRWPNYWSFSLSISPSNEYSGLIFRMDWWIFLQFKGFSILFKSIDSLVLSFLYGPTLTSIPDYWIKHSFD